MALIGGAAASPFLWGCSASKMDAAAPETEQSFAALMAAIAALEAQAGGRLGFAVHDLATGAVAGHRLDERFALCSTFKFPLAAIVLSQGRGGAIDIDTPRKFTAAETEMVWRDTRAAMPEDGFTARQMAEISQKTSDNGCANHLLALIGGPAAMTRHLRDMGDITTRIDRMEPEMNLVLPGEVQDTTTPRAIAALTARLMFGTVLHPEDRTALRQWTIDTETGLKRLRAHLPDGWMAGDKTGSGFNEKDPRMTNKYNDVAWVQTPDNRRFTIAAYYEGPLAAPDMRDEDVAVLAEAGRLTYGAISGQSS